jgi:hypothetical protein
LTEKDQDILESLFDDTPEILLVSVLHGGAIRLLINHGRMDDGSSHTYTNSWRRPSLEPTSGRSSFTLIRPRGCRY